jgi:hypothetical protein
MLKQLVAKQQEMLDIQERIKTLFGNKDKTGEISQLQVKWIKLNAECKKKKDVEKGGERQARKEEIAQLRTILLDSRICKQAALESLQIKEDAIDAKWNAEIRAKIFELADLRQKKSQAMREFRIEKQNVIAPLIENEKDNREKLLTKIAS